MTLDDYFMHLALDQARQAFEKKEIPVGAIAVYNNQVIGRGHNCKETTHNPIAHAEMLALQEAAHSRGGWRLIDVTLYCTLEPCPMCAGAMVQARLPRLVYAVDDPKAGAAGSVVNLLQHPAFNHQVQIVRGVLQAQAEILLADFFSRLRDGTIPRHSKTWRRRKLAKNAEPE